MDPGEVGSPDHTRVVDEFCNDKFGLGVVTASWHVSAERLTDGVEQKVAGIRDSPAEHKTLGVEYRAERGACLPQPVAELLERVHGTGVPRRNERADDVSIEGTVLLARVR